jgi:hypothetical protein
MADRSDIVTGLGLVLRKLNELADLPNAEEAVRQDLHRKWRELMSRLSSNPGRRAVARSCEIDTSGRPAVLQTPGADCQCFSCSSWDIIPGDGLSEVGVLSRSSSEGLLGQRF